MTGRFSVPLRVAAISATTAVLGAMAAFPAVAADNGGVQVVNTETVQVYTDATGSIDTKRIYEQLALTGKGSVKLHNPIETDGLRNLDGFGGFEVKGGQQIANLTVDGEQRLRSVSDYTGKLPLDVKVRYFLNGEAVEPGDVVGKDGKLEVKYTVKNVTGVQQEVTFDDGKGGTVTKSVEVPIPMVGSLSTVAPPNFTDVASSQANMAGDGKGGTKLSFTMTLFPPIGSDTAEFGYTANISDGVVPRASISALPVNPLESPSFKGAGASYKGGADTGVELTDGATQIDENLLKLRDGAGELLAGLIQLRDGATKLDAGLSGVAAPGAQRLASGAGELAGGLGKIDDGAGKLSAGAGRASAGGSELAAGAGKLSGGLTTLNNKVGALDTGAGQLAAGQAGLAAGLSDLYDGVELLPASVKKQLATDRDYQRLLGTLNKIVVGIGGPTDATLDTVMGGLNLLKYGIKSPLGTASCDQDPTDDTDPADDCGAADGAQIISGKFGAGADKIKTQLLPAAQGAYKFVEGALGDACPPLETAGPLAGLPPALVVAPGNPDGYPAPCVAAAGSLYGYGLPASVLSPTDEGGLLAQATLASQKLAFIAQGLSGKAYPGIEGVQKALYNADCDPAQTDSKASDFCGISQAVSLVGAGVPVLVDTLAQKISDQILTALGEPTKGCDPTKTLRCAAAALAGGGGDLVAGVNKLVAGVDKLNAGGSQLSAGAGESRCRSRQARRRRGSARGRHRQGGGRLVAARRRREQARHRSR